MSLHDLLRGKKPPPLTPDGSKTPTPLSKTKGIKSEQSIQVDRILGTRVKSLRSMSSWVSLENKGMIEIPEEVLFNVSLKDLSLAYNMIHILPQSLTEHQGITMIDLSYNRITDPSPFVTMHSLKSLKLRGNDFKEFNVKLESLSELDVTLCGVELIGNLQSLVSLKAAHNSLKELPLFEKLTCLDVRHNFLKTLNIQEMLNLATALLDYNELETIEIPKNMTVLSCRNNKIKSIDLTGKIVKKLNASFNQITEFDPCATLVELNLRGNKICTLNLKTCDSLEDLNASLNNLTEVINFPDTLGVLKLQSNKISKIDLSDIEWLNELNMSDNPIEVLNTSKLGSLKSLLVGYTLLKSIDVRTMVDLTLLYVVETGIEVDRSHLNEECVVYGSKVGLKPPTFQENGGEISLMTGRRSKMEDVTFTHSFISSGQKVSLFGIFDGHNGDSVAIACARHFGTYFEKDFRGSVEKTLISTFTKVNDEIRGLKSDILNCGSTGSVVVIYDGKIFAANVGDSKAVFISEDGVIPLSYEHKPVSERSRILKLGGYVSFDDVNDVGGRLNGTLAMSRAFGDFYLEPYVIVSPYCFQMDMRKGSILIASDGVWDCFDNDTIARFATTAERVRDMAFIHDSIDNISVIQIFS